MFEIFFVLIFWSYNIKLGKKFYIKYIEQDYFNFYSDKSIMNM